MEEITVASNLCRHQGKSTRNMKKVKGNDSTKGTQQFSITVSKEMEIEDLMDKEFKIIFLGKLSKL